MDADQQEQAEVQSSTTGTNREDEESTNDFSAKMKYKKLGNAGIEGVLFQINLLTIFLLNAIEKPYIWRMSTENKAGGKFDDIIFEELGETSNGTTLLQAKHKKNVRKKITNENLLSTNPDNDDFSLPKYFFSYQEVKEQFKVKSVIICTNGNMQVEKGTVNKPCSLTSEDLLYFAGMGKCCYTFCHSIINDLERNIRAYYQENLQRKNICEEIICYENIKDFLSHLRFVAGFPSGENLDQIIQKKISQSKLFRHLHCDVAHKGIHNKMMNWYRQEKGVYLNQKNAMAIVCEILHNRYCQILEEYKIFFEYNSSSCTDPSKRILHIITPDESLLNVIKIYRALQSQNVLIVNPNDDISVQNEIIGCFGASYHKHLIIVRSQTSEQNVKNICYKMSEVLKYNNYKTVILLAQKEDKLAEELKTANMKLFESITDNILFTDLTEDTRVRFLENRVTFQGSEVRLGDLLTEVSNEGLNRILGSEILAKLARSEKVEVGTSVKLVNETVGNHYISRNFNRNKKSISEDTMCLLDENDTEKIILISDYPGMGKSTVLSNMANTMKKNYPNLWIVRIDVNNYTKILRDVQKNSLNSFSLLELLNSHEDTKFNNNFEKKLFSTSGKLVMMIDGVDEISPEYADIIFNLLINFETEAKFAKMFVTTRPHLCDHLERRLKVKSFRLEPFSQQNQIEFLVKYWTNFLSLEEQSVRTKCDIYAKALIRKMSKWIKEYTKYTLVGFPLQTKMLAEIFQDKMLLGDEKLKKWDSCNEFLMSEAEEPNLPSKIDVIELYQYFIARKRDIFIHDKNNLGGSIVAEEILKEKFKEYYNHHYILALEVLFTHRDHGLFRYYKRNRKNLKEKNMLLKIGIVQEVDGQLCFIHRTFAEYFVAECLLNELKREYQNREFQVLFLNYIQHRRYSPIVRTFFNCFLQKELSSLPPRIYKAFRFTNVAYYLRGGFKYLFTSSECTLLHALSEEGCTGILTFLFKCLHFSIYRGPVCGLITKLTRKVNVDIEDELGRTALQLAAGCGHLDVVMLLVEKGANVNRTDKNGCTPFHAAVMSQYLDVAGFLLKTGADVNFRFDGRRNVEGSCIGGTALHLAVHRSSLGAVRFLVENGANIYIKNKDGCNALHLAARNGNVEIVKFLVKKYRNINFQNASGRTALHEAAQGKHTAVRVLLEKCGADVSVRDKFGCTYLDLDADYI